MHAWRDSIAKTRLAIAAGQPITIALDDLIVIGIIDVYYIAILVFLIQEHFLVFKDAVHPVLIHSTQLETDFLVNSVQIFLKYVAPKIVLFFN